MRERLYLVDPEQWKVKPKIAEEPPKKVIPVNPADIVQKQIEEINSPGYLERWKREHPDGI